MVIDVKNSKTLSFVDKGGPKNLIFDWYNFSQNSWFGWYGSMVWRKVTPRTTKQDHLTTAARLVKKCIELGKWFSVLNQLLTLIYANFDCL